MHHLTAGMHTRIGAPGTLYFNRLIRNFRQRLLKHCLDPNTITLTLPAIVGRAVVFDSKCDAGSHSL